MKKSRALNTSLLIFISIFFIYVHVQAKGLYDLLVSTAWCSFSYNKITSYSSTTRYQFFKNGTYVSGGQKEGYSSGSAGSYASQRNSGSQGKWKLIGNVLYLTMNGQVQEPVTLNVKYNNNGSPIIVADGTEFVPCK